MMARTATYVHSVVKPGCRIELMTPPGLSEGDELDVILLTDDVAGAAPRRSLLEVLDSLPKSIGVFKSAQEVDEYIREERGSWER